MAALMSLLSLGPAFDAETETSSGTSVAEAREALAFWRRRLARLPWYRRAARAEAREMAARWQRRLVQAELERWGLTGLGRLLAPFAARWGSRGIRGRRLVSFGLLVLRTTTVGRLLAVAAAALAFSALALAVLMCALVVHAL
jgi:hypothetical protein